MKHFFLFFGCVVVNLLHAQINANYNLNFENVSGGNLPLGWTKVGAEGYDVGLDSEEKTDGRFSVKISTASTQEPNFSGLMFRIPDNLNGKKLELSGKIKTADVVDGFAGLMIRIDPDIAFRDMENQALKGTRDWRQYHIVVPLKPQSTKSIYIGIQLIGKGTAWFDDLQLKIDGKDHADVLRTAMPAIADTAYQNNSRIQEIALSAVAIKRLKDLAQVWGLLKYKHPNVAKGRVNMDAELFRIMPTVIEATKDNGKVNSVIASFIERLGQVNDTPLEDTTHLPIKMEADYAWIDGLDYSAKIKEKLKSIAKQRYPVTSHYYVALSPGGVPTFNEQNYPSASITDVGFRLLAVFRYWNIIQYFSPYRYLIQDKWDHVLEESINDMIVAKTEMDISKSLLRLFANLEDSHGMIFQNKQSLSSFYGRRTIPATIGFVEKKAVVLSLPNSDRSDKNNGLKIGDVIQTVNDTSVEAKVNYYRPYTSASNEDGMYRNIARHLLSTNAPILKLKIDRNGQTKFIESPTYQNGTIGTQPSVNDSVFRQLSNTIGYVNHGLLKKSDLPLLREQINGCKGLIIDMRTPPKATIGLGFAHYLLDTSKPFIKFTHSSLSEAGTFRYTPNSLVGLENSEYFRGPIVILVNESTQSSAEFYTMAYQQAPHAWTIGSQTAGADGDIAMIQLPFDYKVLISSLGIYYPDGGETQQVGVRIDQEVRPTLKGIREGRDEQLEKAIEYINKAEFSKPTQLPKNDRFYKFVIPFVIICFGIIAKFSLQNYGRKRLRK